MTIFERIRLDLSPIQAPSEQEKSITEGSTPADQSRDNVSTQAAHGNNLAPSNIEERRVTSTAILLGAIASIGGFMFGYESGQISGM